MSKQLIALCVINGTFCSLLLKYVHTLFKWSYDDKRQIHSLQNRIAQLERQCNVIRQNVDDLQQSVERIDKKDNANVLQLSTELHQRLDEFINFNYEVLE